MCKVRLETTRQHSRGGRCRCRFAYVDCAQDTTETQTAQTIASAVNTDETDIYIPDKGISTATYYKRLWRILDKEYDVALIILDEIDKLEDDAILMQLACGRSRQSDELQDRGYRDQ